MNSAYQQFKGHLQPTPSDIEGPFYKAGAPLVPDGVIGTVKTRTGKDLVLVGNVLATDGTTIRDALLDVWQADEYGNYDGYGYNLRGKIKADAQGLYHLETIIPGDYQIGDNPPDFRCAHIHFKVTADGYKPLTTQLYFADDKYNATDHWFDPRRVIHHPEGAFDFVLERI